MCQPQELEISSILYSINQLANLNLWDDSAHPISIFSLNKYLDTDTNNIATSLYKITLFVKNRFLDGKTEKDISYITNFDHAS